MRRPAVVVLASVVCFGALWPDAAASQSAPAVGATAPTNAVTVWNANVAKAAMAACLIPGDPLHESRLYAMVHLAIHDALNAIDTPQVALETKTPGSPGVLKPVGEDGHIHVVMPMYLANR